MNAKRNILITGGAGFIGSRIVFKLLLENKGEVYNIDKLGYCSDLSKIDYFFNKNKSLEKNYFFYKADLLKKISLNNLINKIKPNWIINCAAETHVDRSINNPEDFINNNILGTFNLLEICRDYWEKLNPDEKESFRFLQISTDEVFGSIDANSKFKENSPYRPNSPYSASKASSDHLVKAWNSTYGLPTLISNCSNNYGPGQFPEKLIPLCILKALRRENIPIYGDGKNIRDWLHVDDHAAAIIKILEKGKIGESYCIGGSEEHTNNFIVQSICQIISDLRNDNFNYKNLVKYVSDRPGHDKKYAIDSNKLINQLHWKPQISFEEGLLKTVNWYHDNQNWCKKVQEKSGYYGQRIGL